MVVLVSNLANKDNYIKNTIIYHPDGAIIFEEDNLILSDNTCVSIKPFCKEHEPF